MTYILIRCGILGTFSDHTKTKQLAAAPPRSAELNLKLNPEKRAKMRFFAPSRFRMSAAERAKMDSGGGGEGGRGGGVVSLFRRHPMPLWMGFAFIGYMEWRRIRRRQLEKAGEQANLPAEVRKNVSYFIPYCIIACNSSHLT